MKQLIILTFILLNLIQIHAQEDYSENIKLTLDEAIDIAGRQSIYSFKQKNMYLTEYWSFRSYKAEKLPSLSLSTTPFYYERTISSQLVDGEYNLFPYEALTSYGSLDLTQNITKTGGEISVSSDFQRVKNYESGVETFESTPVSIGLSQPLNGYNEFKWNSLIKPLEFEQAKKEYLQSLQQTALYTVNYFFGLAEAEINLKIAETNKHNADTLYMIGKGRFEIGTVTQDELLDLELSSLNANMDLSEAKLDLVQARSELNSFLGMEKNVKIECIIPSQIPTFKIKTNKALEKAYENNPDLLSYNQQLIEADQSIAAAKGENGISAEVDLNLGYNKSSGDSEESGTFKEVYKSPFEDKKIIEVSLDVPIIDWGLKRGQVQMAKSDKQVVEATVRQARIDFEQTIFMDVMEFNMQEDQVNIAAKADTIAQKGYDVTKQRFLIGKVDVIKLNSARNSVDAAKRAYIESIQSYWESYYTIRQLTLHDFKNDKTLIEELDYLLQKN